MNIYMAYNPVRQGTDIFRNDFTPAQLVRIPDEDGRDPAITQLVKELTEEENVSTPIMKDVMTFNSDKASFIFTELAALCGFSAR